MNDPMSAPTVTAATVFCGVCGDQHAAEITCPRCERVGKLRDEAAIRTVEERSPLRVAVGLFALLAIVHIGFIGVLTAASSEKDAAREVAIDWWLSGIDAAIIVAFVVIARRVMLPLLATIGRWWWYPIGAVSGAFTMAVASVAVNAMESVFGASGSSYSDAFLAAGHSWFAVVVSIAVMPAVFEELAFRGVIQSHLSLLVPTAAAIGMTAALFTLLHFNMLSFPHLLVMGLVVGLIRRFSGSIYPGVVLHFVHNGLVVAMEWRELSS